MVLVCGTLRRLNSKRNTVIALGTTIFTSLCLGEQIAKVQRAVNLMFSNSIILIYVKMLHSTIMHIESLIVIQEILVEKQFIRPHARKMLDGQLLW